MVVDHWIFFRDRDHSGVADPGYFGGASVCQTSVLVRLEGNRAVYRCPNLIAFGRDYQTPFVPWPSYRQAEADGTALKHDVDAAHIVDEGSTGRANVTVPASDIRIKTN
jgi:hypothetical protein